MPTTYAIPDGRTVMAATTYTGNGSTQSIANTVNGVSFKPDFVWAKSRSLTDANFVLDSVRGATNNLYTNGTAAEFTQNTVTAFNAGGFSVGSQANGVNTNAATYVAWQWQAGQGTTSSNTSGSITSTVSVNATAGFSIVTFTAPASGNYTVGHGLGVTPAMVIVKDRTSAGYSWYTWQKTFSSATKSYVYLNGTAAVDNTTYTMWGASGNSSTTLGFTVGTSTVANDNNVAYCWSEVAGFSKFGSYTGNGSSDGPFVYTGFRPRFILYKNASGVAEWVLLDSSRNTGNVEDAYLFANTSAAEATFTLMDFLSNGFKLRTSNSTSNGSGNTIIYAAFAENPFKFSNAR